MAWGWLVDRSMRLLVPLAIVAVLGGIGCAGTPPPPKAAENDRAWEEPPMTAPDDPPPSQPRPKLTQTVSLGESPAGVPTRSSAQPVSRSIGPGPAPTAVPWTKRDLFAEDRATLPRTSRPPTRAWYRYGAPTTIVNQAPGGVPPVGGNWPAVR